mmetsp:Transcript_74556/g.218567  ORF Transcript_74556/g.218567 Transcript_74556/m.218567 type:complete len:253 (-) Transcript_74556:287-1045(-)
MPSANILLADVATAVSVSLCIAPFVSTIDKAIMKNAAGSMRIMDSVRRSVITFHTQPLTFVSKPSFLLIWGVFSGTYTCANVLASVCKEVELGQEVQQTLEFVGVSGTLATLNIAKDRILARKFALVPPRPMPASVLGLFGMRDSLTVLASFNLAPVAAHWLEGNGAMAGGGAAVVGQLVTPALMQWVSAPLHLLALNVYNRPDSLAAERCRLIAAQYLGTAIGRSLRVGWAFGFGVLLNKPLRHWSHSQLE